MEPKIVNNAEKPDVYHQAVPLVVKSRVIRRCNQFLNSVTSRPLTQTPKHPNTKHQTPNTKHQTPNTKHQTPNTKHQTPNTKHQTQSFHLLKPTHAFAQLR